MPRGVLTQFGPNRWIHWGSPTRFNGRLDYPFYEQVASIQQSTDIKEMLEQDLKTEKEALAAYRAAHAAVQGDEPIKFMLEDQIMTEQEDVWELEKFLEQIKLQVTAKTINLEAS